MKKDNIIDLKTFVGTFLPYKGYKLKVGEISKIGVTLYDPVSGLSTVVKPEIFKKLKEQELRFKNL